MYENDGFHPYEDNNDAQNRYEAQSSETSGNQWQQPLYQMPQQPEHTQPKKKHTAGRVVALALCCIAGGAKDRKRKKQCVRAHKHLEQYRKLGYKL